MRQPWEDEPPWPQEDAEYHAEHDSTCQCYWCFVNEHGLEDADLEDYKTLKERVLGWEE